MVFDSIRSSRNLRLTVSTIFKLFTSNDSSLFQAFGFAWCWPLGQSLMQTFGYYICNSVGTRWSEYCGRFTSSAYVIIYDSWSNQSYNYSFFLVRFKLNSKKFIFKWVSEPRTSFDLLEKSNVNFENGSSNKWEIHFEMHNGFKSWITSWIIDFNRACSRIGTSIFKTRWIQSETN